MQPQQNTAPLASYSTLFHCTGTPFVCTLRGIQGIISLIIFLKFLMGYRKMVNEQYNPISNEDKRIYMLAMWQTLLLTLYYFLFEEFVILATIRNFLIWIAINTLHVLCKIYWIQDDETLLKVKYVINALKFINIAMWFMISLGEGSKLVNTDFNLGYNCRILDWTFLSGMLLIIITVEAYIGLNIYDKLKWERQHTPAQDKQNIQSIDNESFTLVAQIGCSFVGAFVMFTWDFYANIFSTSDSDCTAIFSGDTFFRQILCFLLKLVTMQLAPLAIYYIIYERRKDRFFDNFKQQNKHEINVDLLDDNASQFNRTMASRIDSRGSLFSDSNARVGSQYF